MIKISNHKENIDLRGKNSKEISEVLNIEFKRIYSNDEFVSVDVGGINWLPAILSFALGTITSGFLKEIGKEIWSKFKGLFIDSKKKKSEIPKFEFEFEYQGIEIIAEIESVDPSELKAALNRLEDILNLISEEEENINQLELRLDLEEGTWKSKK
ncbi:hypothetical protein [Selenihalanaerobacter shriftii]|uniref:Uncharacterized protein n=1 Tax=Selenihalanaerobacter shriftii TaxID=142842 RepID=A0A1T4JMS2_9FIRM|nr:hypothetical protein [Selenihalanaerobacter shriftii]SJZ31472.1 hypothetical protein SAMN02745118_00230 [Selenihalanaerobacter shriftii]